jgi:hypothetical protein
MEKVLQNETVQMMQNENEAMKIMKLEKLELLT